jgi:hypothetical protein
LTIAPGRQQEIKLDLGVYASLPIGAFSETLRIISDDPITPEATVVLNGMVAGAKCRINPEFLNYGNVAAGSTTSRTALFENTGTVDLQINQISWQYGKEFRLAQSASLPITVAAGGSLTLQVDFTSRGTGFRADRMIVGTAQGLSAALGMQASAI